MNVNNDVLGISNEARIADNSYKSMYFKEHTMLLTKDVEINRKIIYTLLEETEIVIDSAENGAQAFYIFIKDSDRYSLTLMDIYIPEMDDYIGKPIDKEVLISKMEKNLHPVNAEPISKDKTSVGVSPSKEGEQNNQTQDYSIFLPYIDVESGLKRLMNNKKLYFTMLENFSKKAMVDELIANIHEGDLQKVMNTAHAIKGVTGNLALNELNAVVLDVESQAKQNEQCAEFIDRLSKTMELTTSCMQKLLGVSNSKKSGEDGVI